MSQKRKDLLEICKKNNIKGVSRKKKSELLEIIQKLEKKSHLNFNKEEFVKKKKMEMLDGKDPITLEPFSEWTEEELKTGIILNQYFYKQDTIKDYVNSIKSDTIRDPIQPHVNIDDSIVKKYRKKETLVQPEKIKILLETHVFPTVYHNFQFYAIYVQLEGFSNKQIQTKLSYSNRRKAFFVGYVPFHINLAHDIHSAFEMKALDTKSTTDALLVRITNFYQSEDIVSEENGKLQIKSLESLPKRMRDWFSFTDDFMYINTEPIDHKQPLSSYNKLLQELDLNLV